METIISLLPELDSFIEKQYPDVTWVRTKVLGHLDKNNQFDYYEISYRLISPCGRWNAIVIWENGKAPMLQRIWR